MKKKRRLTEHTKAESLLATITKKKWMWGGKVMCKIDSKLG